MYSMNNTTTKEANVTYVITADHPWFSEPLVMERGFPFTQRSAEAWVMQYIMRAFPLDWDDMMTLRREMKITLSEEKI